ncbi:hypothetical protein Osc7112_6927 (plasmid) [Oscillatoria nigro-viridis PCC 7112]|uniref:Uncharacterized protein n=1 Tax=Phormidium nigroviride PCC 7112 TaxID=179408 RepID=K9VTW5_9CYAN|nr:hypothetical protein [Oscillatoria nigro-viridis]AFZ11004.1 hypothetical protein Osc7112_6927 [Oscillatoria nigro-viridis PCC 7112]
MRKKCDPNGNPLTPEFATCIALLHGAKTCVRWRTSNSLGMSLLEKSEQQLMDTVTSAIDEAVRNLEALQEAVR